MKTTHIRITKECKELLKERAKEEEKTIAELLEKIVEENFSPETDWEIKSIKRYETII